jgi:hypothetical protein
MFYHNVIGQSKTKLLKLENFDNNTKEKISLSNHIKLYYVSIPYFDNGFGVTGSSAYTNI